MGTVNRTRCVEQTHDSSNTAETRTLMQKLKAELYVKRLEEWKRIDRQGGKYACCAVLCCAMLCLLLHTRRTENAIPGDSGGLGCAGPRHTKTSFGSSLCI
jgi:hypothetical protein